MSVARPIPPGEHVPTADQRVVMHNVPWNHYEALLALRGERSAPRMSFLDGAVELMSPSKDHERIKSYIGMLLEAWALQTGVELSPYGAWTLKEAPKLAGVEPDECYLVGDQNRDRPDLVIEVVWTSGGIDKLEAYRRLGVAEVWLWKNSHLAVHALRGGSYEASGHSVLFPALDLQLLCSLLDRPTATEAVKDFRRAISGRD